MIDNKTLRWLLEVWENFGYESFKLEVKELGLLKKVLQLQKLEKQY